MKIAIIGYSGCGKSTLARYLGKYYQIPVLFLDRVHWLPGWQEQDLEKEVRQVESFLDKNDSWVIDGNYSKLAYERRMNEADQIIFMNFNCFACFMRILRRYIRSKGRSRRSIAPGCPEKLDGEFIRWILHDGRTKKYRKNYANIQKLYRTKVTVIKNQKQLTAFIRSVKIRNDQEAKKHDLYC